MVEVTKVLAVVLLVAASISGQSAPETCLAQNPLFGPVGFQVCLYDSTNTLVTTIPALLGNTVWSIQTALHAGSCYCKMNCSPSQIVCNDTALIGYIAPALNFNLSNGFAKFVYVLENYTFYCICPAADGTYTCLPTYTGAPCDP